MQIKHALSTLIIALISACGGGGSSSGGSSNNSNSTVTTKTVSTNAPIQQAAGLSLSANTAPLDLSCVDYVEFTTTSGRYANNVWNKQAAGSYPYVQCLRQRGALATKELGWRWAWPSNSGTVFGYPEIIMGWKPWNGGKTTNSHLPIKINTISKFNFSYTVETVTNGKHNLATSLWLTDNGVVYNDPTPSHITTEFMIWTDGFDFLPAGSMIGQAVVSGLVFEVWSAPVWGDASGQNSNKWKYVAYRSTTRHLSATLDIKQILNDAVSRGLVSPNDYVSNLELGNEVMSGVGETWVKSISLDVL